MANCVKSVLDNDYGNLDDISIMDEKTLFEIDSDRRFGYNWISEHSVFIHDRVFVGDEDSRAIICAVRVLAVLGDYKIRIISNIFSRLSNISIVFNNNEILNINAILDDVIENDENDILNKFNEILRGVQRICSIYRFLQDGF